MARQRACAHHCTQVLAARWLLFLTHLDRKRLTLARRDGLQQLLNLIEPAIDPVCCVDV